MRKTIQTTLETARRYLDATSPADIAELRRELDHCPGGLDEIVTGLKPTPPARADKGWLKSRHFRLEKFARKYPDEVLHYYVPKDYQAQTPRGLLLFLHGGGHSTPRTAGEGLHKNAAVVDIFEQSGYIVCAPCAPFKRGCYASWNAPEVDEYLRDVIEETSAFYSIAPDHVLLGGFSMGGMGCYHLAHRMADRFVSVWAGAGCWDMGCWSCLTGTTLWLVNGVNDAVLFKRRHGTDIEFARLAHLRLEQAGVPHVYRENGGCHDLSDLRVPLREWLLWAQDRRRDPFHPHVVCVSPRGMSPHIDWRRHKVPLASHQNHIDFHEIQDAPHARWVTIDGLGKDTIIFDLVTMSECRDDDEAAWNDLHLTLRRKHVPAGLVEARLCGAHGIEVIPRNVTGFTLWLDPRMVDFRNAVVRVKGKVRHRGKLVPSLGVLLESYRRHRDWGMLYPAKVQIEGDESWLTRDQIKLPE